MTLADLRAALADRNVQAFLRVIREGESGQDDLAYRVINGGSHFDAPPWKHPYYGIPTTKGGKAAGAYQFLGTTWARVDDALDLGGDFSPANQDLGAVYLIAGRGALDDVKAGNLVSAISKLRDEWVSLPTMGLKRAQETFIGYGGSYTPQAPAETPTAPPMRPQAPIQPEATMPGITDTIAAAAPIVGTALGGPVGGLVGSLAGAIVQMFSATTQKRIDAEIARHGNSPDVVASINGVLSSGVMGLASQITGKADPVEAYTAVVKDPATLVPKIEAATLAKLDEIIPFLDKIASYEDRARAQTIESQDAAAKRQDAPNLRVLMLRYTWIAIAFLAVVLAAAILLQIVYRDDHAPQNDLVVLFGTTLTYLLARIGDMVGYGFGGVMKSQAADAGVSELDSRRPNSH